MRIKFKLMLAMDALVLLSVLMFGLILHTYERSVLEENSVSSRENILESLSKVVSESVLSEDEELLMGYTADLKRVIGELEVAYVASGGKIIAHTDADLAPKQLPLSYSGKRIGGRTEKLLVKSRFSGEEREGVAYSKKKIKVSGTEYEVAVGYSEAKVRERIEAALSAVLDRVLRAGLIVILAATAMALWLSALVTRPLADLVEAFSFTGEGNLDFKLPDTGRRDEIGKLEREFNRMVDRLKELDRLKKDFVSSVTHELKSPLGAIESYLDLMAYEISRSGKDPAFWASNLPRFADNISFIKQNTNRLLRFIGDLLDTARIEKGKFEIARRPSRLEPVIEEAVKFFLEKARASDVRLVFEPGKDKLPQLYLDAERISQVLNNLISNALKYTPAGGEISVTASLVALSQAPDRRSASVVSVAVQDTGGGVPAGDLEKVFDKFYQSSGAREKAKGPKGTGLGLYIVKSIVEAHGGRVFAENRNGGARFVFELPA